MEFASALKASITQILKQLDEAFIVAVAGERGSEAGEHIHISNLACAFAYGRNSFYGALTHWFLIEQ